MKPTQEQVAVTKWLSAIEQDANEPDKVLCHLGQLRRVLAARDAERDARWEAVKVAAQGAADCLEVAIKDGWAASDSIAAKNVQRVRAALANLGAEEKPKCACPNPSLHTELAEGRDIDPSKCANPKPEPKCGKCGYDEKGNRAPCPACSGGKP